MSDLRVDGRRIKPEVVAKLHPEMVQQAKGAARANGADDVFFAVDADTYVASGEGFSKGIQVGDEVRFEGRTGRVVDVDNEINTAMEGVRAHLSPGLVAGVPLAAVAAVGAKVLKGSSTTVKVAAAAGAVVGLGVMAGIGIYDAVTRKPNYASLLRFAQYD